MATLAGFSADWHRLFFRVPLLSVLADENGAASRRPKLTLLVGFYVAQFHRGIDVCAEGGIHTVQAGEVAVRAHGHFPGAVWSLRFGFRVFANLAGLEIRNLVRVAMD